MLPREKHSFGGCMVNLYSAFGLMPIANGRLEIGRLNIVGKQVMKWI
jgi:hypothetical protein